MVPCRQIDNRIAFSRANNPQCLSRMKFGTNVPGAFDRQADRHPRHSFPCRIYCRRRAITFCTVIATKSTRLPAAQTSDDAHIAEIVERGSGLSVCLVHNAVFCTAGVKSGRAAGFARAAEGSELSRPCRGANRRTAMCVVSSQSGISSAIIETSSV